MTTSSLELRTFDEAHLDRFVELASTYYAERHDARNPAYLRWAFLENPAGKGRVAIARTESGVWTGMMGLVPFRIRHGELEFTANMVVNVLVHPEHRQQKLFVKMIQHACRELSGTGEWLIGHPNAAAVPGWKRAGMAFRPGYTMRVAPPRLGRRGKRDRRVKGDRALRDLDFAPLHAWQRRLDQPVIATDAQFLIWRFLSHPSRGYRVFVDAENGAVHGYRVDRAFRTPLVRWIVDWQGEEQWIRGPSRGLLPSLVAWPVDAPSPRGTYLPPRARKHFEFFATPCGTRHHDRNEWRTLTLAATDFA